MDALLAVLICSDDFLRQDLFSRLAKCQLSVPFILPDPFTKHLVLPLWAMRTIINDFASNTGNKMQKTHSMITYPMPIVSFVRIGNHTKISSSKSKIMNDVIGDEGCNHFFHRDCPGGHLKSCLKNGLVDMAWYLPAGKSNDLFSDAITFLNLHGDARHHLEQLRVLSEISSMCIVVLLEHNIEIDTQCMDILNTIYSSPGGLTVLNGSEEKPTLKLNFPKLYLINLRERTAAQAKDTIRNRLRKKLEKITSFSSIEYQVQDLRGEKVVVDESSDLYRKGLLHANTIKKLIVDHKSSNLSVKEEMIPLQGDKLWRTWAYYDKEEHRQTRIGSETVIQYTEKINSHKTSVRNKQLEHVENLSSVMKLFIDALIEFGEVYLRNYFLQCLKLELNSLSRENVSDKQQRYQLVRKELSKLQAETGKSKAESKAKINVFKKELEDLQEDIINSSFGLEHLLRELGQVYEAALQSKSYADYYSYHLPKIAAELLIDGYPLELMDGDAAHVPLKWVSAVLKEAVKILHNPNIFVLSVLGLQSTGKSTMLNTAFGLQFNVSAGRCTRGAFMQLLSLDEDFQHKTNCNFVLVVDTEGLRAPELDPLKTQKHDNELATFVIGLANMTLINIYGEVPGDMDDILQTSVHAFLRMNKVKYSPRCQFVHQNAGLNIKGEVGRAKFTKKLNQFTLDAAREEHCEGQYENFNDVIKFDDQKDVHYFPGLWKGDPPMAPINHGYSHTAQFLKHHLVGIICHRTGKQKMVSQSGEKFGDLSLKSFSVKISDLWETLLKEKFVFSFKNTLEITAYNSLERAYTKWEWTIQSSMLEWEQKAENEISTEPLQSVSRLVQEKHRELIQYVDHNLYKPLKKDMETFFEGKQCEILAQWKSRFEIRFSTFISDVKRHAQQHCDKLLKSREAISEFEKTRSRNTEFIKTKVQQHIEKVKREQEQLKNGLKSHQLDDKQLQTLLARDLFTGEKIKSYVDQKIITLESGNLILQIVKIRRRLDIFGMKNIIESVLDVNQVEKILKKTQQTEEELILTFDLIWQDLIKQIPPVKNASRNIHMEVEKILVEFAATSQGYDGALIQIIQQESKTNGQPFEFIPDRDTHYKYKPEKHTGYIKKMYNKVWGTNPHQQLACHITKSVFDEAEQYVQQLTAKDTDFNPALTKKLLRMLEKSIKKYSETNEGVIKFTPHYYLQIYVRACAYATPHFENMARKFEKKNDPIEYLQKNVKLPLFTKFKNQYKQTESEEALADTLCAYLEEPIKLQVEKTLGSKIVHKMKASEHYFSSKMALKVKILTDLYKRNDFQGYMTYIKKVQTCLTDFIREYTEDYCDEVLSNGNTRLQVTAKDDVSRLVTIVKNVVSELNVNNIFEWLQQFSSNTTLRSEIGANIKADDFGYDASEELNLENFKQNIYTGLNKLMENCYKYFDTIMFKSEINSWKDKPHDLLKSLIGCTEQCPFCGEQCDLLEHDPSVQEHRTETHRLSCLAGWRDISTKKKLIEICPTQVAGDCRFRRPDGEFHPYQNYKEVYPQWSIPPDVTSKSCLYWKWFMGEYKNEIAAEFDAVAPDIPDEWCHIEWEKVKKNLESSYNVEL